VREGVIDSLIRLTKQMPDVYEISALCVEAIHHLSNDGDAFGGKLVEMNVVHVLAMLVHIHSDRADLMRDCALTLSNVSCLGLSHPDIVMNTGLVPALHKILKLHSEDHAVIEACGNVLFNVIDSASNLDAISRIDNYIDGIVKIIELGNAKTRVRGTRAFCQLSYHSKSQTFLVERALGAIIGIIGMAHVPVETRIDALKSLMNLVACNEAAREVAVRKNAIVALAGLVKRIPPTDIESQSYVGRIIKMISMYVNGRIFIQEQGGMKVLSSLSKSDNSAIKIDVAMALENLSRCKYQLNLVDEGCIDSLFRLCCHDFNKDTVPVCRFSSACVRNLSTNRTTLSRLVLESRLMPVLKIFANCPDVETKYNTCISLHNILSNYSTQEIMIRRGIISTIVKLAEEGDTRMRVIGSTALHQLKQEHLKDGRAISLLLDLLGVDETLLSDVETMCPERPKEDYFESKWECAKESTCTYINKTIPVEWSPIFIKRTWSTKTEVAEIKKYIPQSFLSSDVSYCTARKVTEFEKVRKIEICLKKRRLEEVESIMSIKQARAIKPLRDDERNGDDESADESEGNDNDSRRESIRNISERCSIRKKIRESNMKRSIFQTPAVIPPPSDVIA